MAAANDPNLVVGEIALVGLVIAFFWRLLVWIRECPKTPDPWDTETENQLHESDAVEVCPHCLTAQDPNGWFCPTCGKATGPYNNLMPFINVFSEGEVLRTGASGKLRPTPLIVVGYLLLSLSLFFPISLYASPRFVAVFLAIYWFFLLRNFARQDKAAEENREES